MEEGRRGQRAYFDSVLYTYCPINRHMATANHGPENSGAQERSRPCAPTTWPPAHLADRSAPGPASRS